MYNASAVGSKLERFCVKEIFVIKTRHAIICAADFYNAGVVTQCHRIDSRSINLFQILTFTFLHTYMALPGAKSYDF
jgi:hypothetical protein